MLWLIGGYLWLYVHRPFEYYPFLGDLQIERIYVITMILGWAVSPRKALVTNRIHVAVAAFVMMFTFCWLLSPWRDKTYDTLENYYKIIVFYIIFITTVNDRDSLRTVVKMYIGAVALYMGHSILEFYNGRCEWRMGIRRMVGVDITYHDSNAFASTLLLSLPMTLPFWREAKTFKQRLPPLVHCSLVGLCVMLTGSRTGFLGLLLFVLFCLMLSRYRVRMLLLMAPCLMVGVLLLPGELQNRFLTIIDPSVGPANARDSAEGRMVGLSHGWRLFSSNPLFGAGPGAFPMASGIGFNPHNVYGQIIGELGLAGITTFGAILLCFLFNCRETARLYREHPEWSRDLPFDVSRAVGLDVLMMLFTGMAGHNLYRYNWLWYAAFGAAALHCVRQRAAAELTLGIPLLRRRLPARVPAALPYSPRPRFTT
jgi:hypothetical protein